jgi:hypothetical protein
MNALVDVAGSSTELVENKLTACRSRESGGASRTKVYALLTEVERTQGRRLVAGSLGVERVG